MGIAESLQEKWESLLEWSDEKGLPLRGISDSLEEKGIPAMPFFLVLLLLLVGGTLYLTLGGGQVSIFAPKETSILLTLKDSAGRPLANTEVMLTPESNDVPSPEKATTDEDGKVTFEKIKIGTAFLVAASDFQGESLNFESDRIAVTPTKSTFILALSAPLIEPKVSLTVNLKGLGSGESAQIYLFEGPDRLSVPGSPKPGLAVSYSDLAVNTEFFVKVEAQGYNKENRTIYLKENDESISITLRPRDKIINGKVRVHVTDAATARALKDVSVDIIDSVTNTKIFTNLKTGENGEISPQELAIGKIVKAVARLQGYVVKSAEKTIEDETNFLLALDKIPEAELKAIKVIVLDMGDSQIVNPVAKLYDEKFTKVGESNPMDGVALFNDVGSGQYYITVVKPGFLPATLQNAEKGNSYTVYMESASTANSAKLKVQVENQNGDAVPQSAVSLFYEDGTPVGSIDKIAGNDGIASYEELPLVKIYAKASFNGRNGMSSIVELSLAGTGEETGINLLKVALKPAKGRAVVLVKDHFTGKNVDNAKVEFSPSDVEFSPIASCTTKAGRCTAQLQEGFYVAIVSANKYDLFTSSEFEVKPNIDNKVSFGIMLSEIAQKTKIAYSGVFNLKGEQVNTLSPSTTYNARFVINRPKVKITRVEVQVRIGNAGVALENEQAEIIGYDAVGAVVTKGTSTDASAIATLQPNIEGTETPSAAASLNLADVDSDAYKYAHFDFQPFEGSKEVSVQFRTRAVSNGKVELQYRSAFFTDKEVLRDPIDNSAPRGAFLANMQAQSLTISFEGKCDNGICLQSNFEGSSGTAEDNFEAPISETFKLNFKIVAPKGATVELSAPLDDQTISLTEGLSGASKAVLKTTENRQILSLSTSSDNAEGGFTLQARRLVNNIDLQLSVKSGESTITKPLSLRIVGEKPDLKVSFNVIVEKGGGKILKALKENRVVFTVTDSLNLPLKNAFVTLGSGADALGGAVLEAELQEAKDGTITYVIENVNPPSIGSVSFRVTAEGFKVKAGTIQTQATTLFQLDTRALSISTSSDQIEVSAFNVENLLSNELKVTYTLTSTTGKYTDVTLEKGGATVKGLERDTNNLEAEISDLIIKVSNKPQVLKEKITGKVRIVAKLGASEQTEDIPFTVTTDFKQDDLNALWSISPDSLSFSVAPPKIKQESQTIIIANNAPYPILVNHQSSSPNVYVEPLSKNLDIGETAEFTVYGRATSTESCKFEEETFKGKIDFYASSNGINSKKTATTEVAVASTETCTIENALQVTLPVSLTAQLPANTKTKYNADGTILIELPSKERFIFGAGAQLTSSANQYSSYANQPAFPAVTSGGGSYIIVPAGVFIEASPKYVQQTPMLQPIGYTGFSTTGLSPYARSLSTSSYKLAFPFTTFIDFEPETEFSQKDSQKIASIEDFDLYFPSSVPLVRGRSSNERRATIPPNTYIGIQLTPFTNSQDSIEVYFPVDTTFVIQERVRIRTDDYTGSRAIQFDSGTTITLPPDSRSSTDPVATGGSGDLFNEQRKITIPAATAVRIPPPYAQEGMNGELHLQLPFKLQFKVPKSDRIALALDAGATQARSISTEVYELLFAQGTTRVGLEYADGSRLIEALPAAPITIQPTDFGVVGITRKLPVSITINLPSSAAVKRKGALTQIQFENGNRMLMENVEVNEKAFEAKEVTIAAGTEITFSANAPGAGNRMIKVEKSEYGTESFTIKIPEQTTYHFPLANALLTPPNSIRNENEGYRVIYAVERLAFQRNDNYNDIALAKLDSLKGVTFTQIDPTPEGRDFEMRFSFPVMAEIPGDVFLQPKLEPYKQKIEEIYHSFRFAEAAEIKLADHEQKDEFSFLGNRLMMKQYDFTSADFISDPKTLTIPGTMTIVATIKKDDDGKYWLHAVFGKEVSVSLPSTAQTFDDKQKIANLGGCKNIKIEIAGEDAPREYELPSVKSIVFEEDARLLPGTSNNPEKPQEIVVREADKISFELCETKAKKDKFAFIADASSPLVAFEAPPEGGKPDTADKLLDLEFDDTNAQGSQARYVCVQNWGFSNLAVEFRLDDDPLMSRTTLEKRYVGYTGESVSGELDGALKSVTRPIAWQVDPKMIIKSVDPAKQNCKYQSFRLDIGVPSQYLDEDGCILESANGRVTDPDSETYVTLFGEYNGKAVTEKIGIKIKLDKGTGTCSGSLFKQFRKMMNGFYVNYADDQQNVRFDNALMKLSFKSINHERAIAAVNNLDKAITYSVTGDTQLVSCSPSTGTLEPGKGTVLKCVSKKKGKGRLKITPSDSAGDINEYIRYVNIEVFEPEPDFKALYSASPLGDLAPQEAATAEAEVTLSGYVDRFYSDVNAQSFADDAPSSVGPKPQVFTTLDASVMKCQTNFCTSVQVETAFTEFAGEFKTLVETLASDAEYPNDLTKFCEKTLSDGGYKKSIVLQAANSETLLDSERSLELSKSEFDSILKQSDDGFKITTSTVDVKGCGVYILEGRLDICKFATAPSKKADWLKYSNIEFRLTPGMECNFTLANAALLVAERGNTEGVVGRELSTGIGWNIGDDSGSEAGGLIGLLDKVQLFTVGPYKRTANRVDIQNLNILYRTLYKIDRSEAMAVAEPYEAGWYCAGYMTGGVVATMGVASLALGGSLLTNFGKALTGVGAPSAVWNEVMAIKAAYGLSTTAALCGASIYQGLTFRAADTSKTPVCEVANNCLAGGFAGATELLITAIPGGGEGLKFGAAFGGKFLFELVGFVALTTAIDGVTAGYNFVTGDDTPTYTSTPAMYGGLKVAKTFGSRAYLMDYLTRSGMGIKDASTLAGRIMEANSPVAGTLAAAQTLGFDTATGTTNLDWYDQQLNAKRVGLTKAEMMAQFEKDLTQNPEAFMMRQNELTKAYEQMDPKGFADAAKKRGNIVEEMKLLRSEREALKKEHTALTGKRPPSKLTGAAAFRYGEIAQDISAVDQTLISYADDFFTEEEKLTQKAIDTLSRRFKGVGTPAVLSSKAKALLNVEALTDPAGAYAKLGLTTEQANKLVGEVKRQEQAAKGRLRRFFGGEYGELERFRKSRNIISLLIPLLFHVDVRPVQGALDYRFPHHLVSYNVDEGSALSWDKASMRRICARNLGEEEGCLNALDSGAMCDPADSSICIYLIKGRQYATEQGYTLITGVNKGIDPEKLYKSLFLTIEAPVTKMDISADQVFTQVVDKITDLPAAPSDETPVQQPNAAVAARNMYEQLRDACEVNGYCPGSITGEYLDSISEKLDAQPDWALNDMLSKSKITK
ncbi:MAG: hypothetical protein V1835_03095 [Candidatus Micrarchaeota archaeon]